MVDRTNKLFPIVTTQLPDSTRTLFDPSLHVNAPLTLKLTPDAPDVELLDLLRWVEQERGIDQETVSTLAYTLLFRLMGVDGLIDAADPEQWLQLTKEVKERLKA